MAASSFSPFLPSSSSRILPTKKIQASISPPWPSSAKKIRNYIKRKNHLRQKILKTLTKPRHPPPEILDPPSQYIDPPSQYVENPADQIPLEIDSDLVEEREGGNAVEEVEIQVFQTTIPEPEVLENFDSVQFSSGFVLRTALGFLGLLVIQTAVAVWIFGGSGGDSKDVSVRVTESEPDNEISAKCDDESKMNDEISRIRVMAREVRASERKKLENGAKEENENSRVDTDIQKEVEGRLKTLRKNIKSRRMKALSVEDGESEQPNNPNGGSRKNGNSFEIPKRSSKMEMPRKIESKVNGLDPHSQRLKNGESLKRSELKGRGNAKAGNLWWHQLPYVYLILLRRGPDGEGPRGFYFLKVNPSDNGRSTSYTVAFEDRGDASNFSYLLESFFEELGDFRADAVPLSIQEFERETASRSNKIIVVKKGQLQLYAGQPLVDAEMALRSILE